MEDNTVNSTITKETAFGALSKDEIQSNVKTLVDNDAFVEYLATPEDPLLKEKIRGWVSEALEVQKVNRRIVKALITALN